MVTKSKAKPAQSPYVWSSTIGEVDESIIAECLAIDRELEPEGLGESLSVLTHWLSIFNKRMSSIVEQPLATHIAAALEPIANYSLALVPHLNATTIQPQVLRALALTHDDVHVLQSLLTSIAENAASETKRLRAIKSAGVPLQRFSEALQDARKVLGDLFEQLRRTEEDEDPKERRLSKSEFIDLCRGYLPPSPQRQKRKAGAPAVGKQVKS